MTTSTSPQCRDMMRTSTGAVSSAAAPQPFPAQTGDGAVQARLSVNAIEPGTDEGGQAQLAPERKLVIGGDGELPRQQCWPRTAHSASRGGAP